MYGRTVTWADLVDDVRAELTAAGLTVVGDEPHDSPGVSVTVDDGSVRARWNPGPALTRAARAVLRRGAYALEHDDAHPALRHSGVVVDAMNDAIARILTASGFDVQADTDDYGPMGLLVTARQAGPHWRDPIGPPLDGHSGFMPGVRVRVLAGEYTGIELFVHSVPMSSGRPSGYRLHRPDGDGLVEVAVDDVEFAGDDDWD